MVDAAEASDRSRHRDFRLVRTQRALQIVLGLFWLLDAGLQFQPYMFSSNFTTTYLLNNAQNQPDVIRWIITNVGNFVGHMSRSGTPSLRSSKWPSDWGCSFARPCDPPRCLVPLGLRRLVLRRRARPDLHRLGVCPHRSPGVGVPVRTDRADGMATVSSHRGG